MDHNNPLLVWVLVSSLIASGESCHCDKYPWASWSSCSKSCNYGTQSRSRQITYDEYYTKNGCDQWCTKHESRACSEQACPISCQVGDFGSWSDCDPCVKKQFRVRALVRPSQFGGASCSEQLVDSRRCIPSKLCNLEEVDCKTKFKCDTGRCIARSLECNGENDCGDNSDERDCRRRRPVCARRYEGVPSAQLMGNGYNILAGESRGEVLDNTFYGGKCNTIKSNRTTYRLPANLANATFQEKAIEDDVKTEFYSNLANLNLGRHITNVRSGSSSDSWGVPILWGSSSDTSTMSTASVREAVQASHKKDSNFIRIHKEIAVSEFTTKESDLFLSDVFLKSLRSLPLEYNFALYSRIFDDFGTHYLTSGSVGGTYDLLYQFSAEQLKTTGMTQEQSQVCCRTETREQYLLFFTRTTVREKCVLKSSSSYTEVNQPHHIICLQNSSISQDYELQVKYLGARRMISGSFLQSSEKSISLVKGGRAEYAAALAWKRKGAFPDTRIFRDWLESTKDNPSVLSFKLAPILDLVKGIPCAVTKRRNLRKAINEYMEKFDPCKCAPCPNNGRPVLSGTECLCICQSGTYGENCEKQSPDYKSVAVDGYWSCWSSWRACDASLKRRRSRSCNNPSPLNGGKPCEGEQEQDEDCHFSLFMDEGALCINDDEDRKEEGGGVDPEPTTGCSKPTPPEHAYLRIEKVQYSVAEEVEIVCLSGYELDGYQFFKCLPDGSWRKQPIECRLSVCSRPPASATVSINPYKMDYKVAERIQLSCSPGFVLTGQPWYTCGIELSWEPPILRELTCEKERETTADGRCSPGQKVVGNECICMAPGDDCGHYSEDLCVYDATSEKAITQPSCQYLAEKCQGEKQVHFLSSGPCQDVNLTWELDRIELSANSTKKVMCGYNMCYDWEKCSDKLSQCICLLPYQCTRPKDNTPLYCIQIGSTGRRKTGDLCTLGAMKCTKIKAVIEHDGKCTD